MASFNKVNVKKLYLPTAHGTRKGHGNKPTLVTATADELNIMDGVTATAAELNIMDGVTATALEINNGCDQSLQHEILTATKSLDAYDHGKTFWLNSATEFTTTLPAIATAGLGYTVEFIVMAAPAGANYVITELGTSDTNKIITNGIEEGEVDTETDSLYSTGHTFVNFIQSAAVAGDRARFVCNGVNWFCTGCTKADGGITLT